MADDLQKLLAEQKKHDDAGAALANKIKAARAANASAVFDQVADLLADNVEHFSTAQINHLRRVIEKDPKANRKSTGTIEPKFQLDSGETWTGRGRTSKAFAEFAASAEGKAWKKANNGQSYPAYPNPKAKK